MFLDEEVEDALGDPFVGPETTTQPPVDEDVGIHTVRSPDSNSPSIFELKPCTFHFRFQRQPIPLHNRKCTAPLRYPVP